MGALQPMAPIFRNQDKIVAIMDVSGPPSACQDGSARVANRGIAIDFLYGVRVQNGQLGERVSDLSKNLSSDDWP
jgi:hypothetical protein